MSTISTTSQILNDYNNITEPNRTRAREICGQMMKNGIDGSTALIESLRRLNAPEFQGHHGGNPTIQRKLDNWYLEYKNQNLAHRRHMARMLSNLKLIARDQPNSEGIVNDIDRIAQKNLNENNFGIGYINPKEGQSKINGILRVIDPNLNKGLTQPTRGTSIGHSYPRAYAFSPKILQNRRKWKSNSNRQTSCRNTFRHEKKRFCSIS